MGDKSGNGMLLCMLYSGGLVMSTLHVNVTYRRLPLGVTSCHCVMSRNNGNFTTIREIPHRIHQDMDVCGGLFISIRIKKDEDQGTKSRYDIKVDMLI